MESGRKLLMQHERGPSMEWFMTQCLPFEFSKLVIENPSILNRSNILNFLSTLN